MLLRSKNVLQLGLQAAYTLDRLGLSLRALLSELHCMLGSGFCVGELLQGEFFSLMRESEPLAEDLRGVLPLGQGLLHPLQVLLRLPLALLIEGPGAGDLHRVSLPISESALHVEYTLLSHRPSLVLLALPRAELVHLLCPPVNIHLLGVQLHEPQMVGEVFDHLRRLALSLSDDLLLVHEFGMHKLSLLHDGLPMPKLVKRRQRKCLRVVILADLLGPLGVDELELMLAVLEIRCRRREALLRHPQFQLGLFNLGNEVSARELHGRSFAHHVELPLLRSSELQAQVIIEDVLMRLTTRAVRWRH